MLFCLLKIEPSLRKFDIMEKVFYVYKGLTKRGGEQ